MDDENKVVQISDYIAAEEESDSDYEDLYEDGSEQPEEQDAAEEDDGSGYVPYGIIAYRNKLYLISGIFLVLGTATSIYAKSLTPLILVAAAVYFFVKGLSAVKRYYNGLIREVPVLCTSVRPATIRDRLTVTFRTETEDDETGQEYFKFLNQPKRAADNFVVGHPYLIYYDVENPQALLYYIDL